MKLCLFANMLSWNFMKPFCQAFYFHCIIHFSSTESIAEIIKTDEILVGKNPVITKTVQSLLQCQHLCVKHMPCLCHSFNLVPKLYPKQFECQLLNFTLLSNEDAAIQPISGGKHVQLKQTSTKADCLQWKEDGCTSSGVYPILIDKITKNVYCDMVTDGGGWIVFQTRFDESLQFNKSWNEYKNGFGNLDGEFWLGNEIVHQLTSRRTEGMELWYEGTTATKTMYRKNRYFKLASESDFYKLDANLEFMSGYPLITYQPVFNIRSIIGMKFSTVDMDNDRSSLSCAMKSYSAGVGWWYNACYEVNLNSMGYGFLWLLGPEYTYYAELIASRMMIR